MPPTVATIYGDAPAEERPNLMVWSWWPDYNDAWNHLYPQVSCEQWGSKGANGGFYCNERVEELLAEAKDAVDESTYERALAEVQQILSRDDPPAIYYAQPEWTTVLQSGRRRVRLQPDQHRHLRSVGAVPQGIAARFSSERDTAGPVRTGRSLRLPVNARGRRAPGQWSWSSNCCLPFTL